MNQEVLKDDQMNASEAIFGFAAFLTTRNKGITIGSSHLTPPVIELVEQFIKANNMPALREGWEKNLVSIPDEEPAIETGVTQEQLIEAVANLCYALKHDAGYWEAWKANIAVAFQDAWRQTASSIGAINATEKVHEISNTAANNFLTLLTRNPPIDNIKTVPENRE